MNREKLIKPLLGLGLLTMFVAPVSIAHLYAARTIVVAPAEATLSTAKTTAERDLDLERGRIAFMRNCAMCHGYAAVGRLGHAPSLNTPEFLSVATDAFIRRTVREGRLGSAMAPRRDLSRGDLAAIIHYLRSLPGRPVEPGQLDEEFVARGDPTAGEDTYGRFCSSCHGQYAAGYAERGTAPGIGLPGFLHQVSDDFIMKTLEGGRRGTAMRSFLGSGGLANLQRQDLSDIIVFLRDQDDSGLPDFLPFFGEDVFYQNCVPCHQEGARGKVGVAPSLRSPEFLALATDDFIRRTVREGRLGTAMVARTSVTDWELDAIVEYLRSLPTNGQSSLTLDESLRVTGDPSRGRKTFATYCAPCHGPRGEGYAMGGSGPSIGLRSFLAAVSDDYVLKTVKNGRSGTPMRPFSGPQGLASLEDQEIKDVIVFLRSRTILP